MAIQVKSYHLVKIFFASLLFVSCTAAQKNNSMNNEIKNTPLKGWEYFDKQGHRGCRGLMPENTIRAMINALSLGVTTLEMDVCISKDNKVFLSHEPFFNHEITTLPGGGLVPENNERQLNMYTMDYDSIIKYDVGLKPHPRFPHQQKMKAVKPLLADVFKAVKEYMITAKRPYPFFNIETKTLPEGDNIYHPMPDKFVKLMMDVIIENKMEDFVTIQSFDYRSLQYLHQHYPKIQTALLIEANDKNSFRKQLKDLGFTPTIYSPESALVIPTLIKQCHDLGMQIIPWTVNDKKEIERLKKMGVDGIITDYPDLFNE